MAAVGMLVCTRAHLSLRVCVVCCVLCVVCVCVCRRGGASGQQEVTVKVGTSQTHRQDAKTMFSTQSETHKYVIGPLHVCVCVCVCVPRVTCTWVADCICTRCAFCLHRGVRTRVVLSAFRAGVVLGVERATPALFACCRIIVCRGHEFLPRRTLRD